jgi:tetratricopeptide (TPR) repeat protein
MKWTVHAVWAIVAITLALGVGIVMRQKPHDVAPSVTELTDPSDAIGENLMVALLQAKNFHWKAKVYQSEGKLPEAIAAVREILSLKFPAGAPEAEDVRNDARALLAKLLVEQGDLDQAMRVVDEGLAAATRESFFVANLHTVRGEILYARAAKLDAADPMSTEVKHSSIEEFEKSIKINEKIQKQLESK